MSRKDFELIARVLANASYLDPDTARQLADNFADALRSTNSRFNTARFVDACLKLSGK